jgi:hypothetical protein
LCGNSFSGERKKSFFLKYNITVKFSKSF